MSIRSLFVKSILAVLFLLGTASCLEEQLDYGREAERNYVDLLYALDHADQAASLRAMASFDETIQLLRKHWYYPMSDSRVEEMLYHLEKAEWAYADCRASIQENYLTLAAVQLDRATYELWAANPASFQELYVGSIYDFVTNWLEVDYAVRDMDLCQLEWNEFTHNARNARVIWRQARYRKPSDIIYPVTEIDRELFRSAHAELDEAMNAFVAELREGDQCSAQPHAGRVTEAMWALVLLFGSGLHHS